MSKSNHSQLLPALLHCCLFAILLCFSQLLYSQIAIRGEVFYDILEGEGDKAKVKVLKDNELFEELETNKKGKFRVMLPLGHDYLFEVSKEFHFTTKFVVSTKLPEEKMQGDVYASFDIVSDLIRNYKGLDGSIMDKPIMILRFIPEENGFDFDKDHLNAVRERVERLMDESDKLKQKGADPVSKPLPAQAKKAEVKLPEPKEEVVIEEEKMETGTVHEDPEPEPVAVKEPESEPEPEPVAEVVTPKKEPEAKVNETYEQQMRRERLEKEKQKKENLALKRGYESSLIRQVAEESRRMSQAEYQKKTQEKEDESMIEKERKEAEMKKARNEQREKQIAKTQEASSNKNTKSRMESGMIRDVAASTKVINAVAISESEKKAVGEETADGQKFVLDAKVREDEQKDDFKVVENLYIEYPSYSTIYSKETYNFGMINYYIDNQAVEKDEFCKSLSELKSYKFKLRCN